jgi:SWI/SNF-related matrix-associated actin-dependent regulator 1 of chromatin subfamily A
LDYKLDYLVEDLSLMSDFEIHQLCRKYKRANQHCLSPNAWMESGKINTLKRMLPELKQKVFVTDVGRSCIAIQSVCNHA